MIRPSLVLIPQHFGALLFDRRSSRYMPFDAPAAAVLTRLTEHTADDVIGDAEAGDRDAVIGLIQHLSIKGYLRMDGRLAAARIDRAPPPDHLLGRSRSTWRSLARATSRARTASRGSCRAISPRSP